MIKCHQHTKYLNLNKNRNKNSQESLDLNSILKININSSKIKDRILFPIKISHMKEILEYTWNSQVKYIFMLYFMLTFSSIICSLIKIKDWTNCYSNFKMHLWTVLKIFQIVKERLQIFCIYLFSFAEVGFFMKIMKNKLCFNLRKDDKKVILSKLVSLQRIRINKLFMFFPTRK